jgi:hypothetical protein
MLPQLTPVQPSKSGRPARKDAADKEFNTMGLIIIALLVILLLASLPTWGYSNKWGYGPTGGMFFLLVIVIVLLIMGVIPR